MNVIKKSKCPFQNRTFVKGIKRIFFQLNLSIHHKSSPPLVDKSKKNDLHSIKPEKSLPIKFDRIQRDIFGATILPQNLSFENSKKLTENQVKLEDIPIIDENAVAEVLMAEKLRDKKPNPLKESKKRDEEDDTGVVVIDEALERQSKPASKPSGDVFSAAHSYEDIPGPKILRIFFNIIKNFTRQVTIASLPQFLKRNASATFRIYGPIVKLPDILGGKIVLISRPDHISAVFDQDVRYPVNSTFDSVQRARLMQYKKNAKGYDLSEEEWENLRNSVSNPPVKESEKYFEEIDDASSKFSRRIRAIRNGQNEVPDDFLFEINKWSLECLCLVIFEKSFGFLEYDHASSFSKASQLLYSLTVATKNLCSLETGFQFWRFTNTYSLSSLSSACSILESIISESVAQAQLNLIRRKCASGEKSLRNFSVLEGLLLQDNLTPDDVVNHIMDTLLIGTNTISVALGFLFYHLSRNLRCQAELWKEVKAVLPEKYSKLEYEQLRSLKYLHACLKESLRLKVPMPILMRVLSNNVVLENYQIPKGTCVLMVRQVESMKEENFSDPIEFIPERWFDRENDHKFQLFPFRNYFEGIIETFLAEVSILICACHVVRHFLIRHCYEEIQATHTTISFPNKPLKLTFIERKD